MIYWDTSVILKLYVEEEDSAHWQASALLQSLPLRSSALLKGELAHALKQKEQRGEIIAGAAKALFAIFSEDLAAGRFVLIPVGEDVLASAAGLALEGVALRTLDGLHLATAVVSQCRQMATTDTRLAEAARRKGFTVLEGADL